VWPIAAFALPAYSLVSQPYVAFWRVDARALLIVAWLLVLCTLIAVDSKTTQTRQPTRGLPALTMLFIVWASLFWLTIVWDAGIGRLVLGTAKDDRIIWTFQLWETRRPSEHLFLAWLTPDEFARGEAYTNHLHPYLFFLYGVMKLTQLVTGASMHVARNLTPFAIAAIGVAAFTALLSRSSSFPARPGLKFHVTLFLMLGFFISERHYWLAFYTANFDNVFPLVSYLTAILWASAHPRLSAANRPAVIACATLFGAFGWVYTPFVVLGLWFYFGERRRTMAATLTANRVLIQASLACAVTGAMTLLLPLLLVRAKGYTTASSSFMFRSGLDGDTRYFADLGQAVLFPFNAGWRTWWGVLAVFLPLLICLAWGMAGRQGARFRTFGQFVFVASLYLWSLALFPQSVSIHPYLYDQLLFAPAALVGSISTLAPHVQRRLRGPYLLLGLMLAIVLTMSNLIAVAQAAVRVLAK
jgi:hypothetical protein